MKPVHILLAFAGAAFLASCDQHSSTKADGGSAPEAATPPPAPSAEVTAALAAQPIGGKLLGNTVMLVGDRFEAADLAKAPDYYLVYYSASW